MPLAFTLTLPNCALAGCHVVTELPDDRSSIAIAMAWASRITTVALEMVLPGIAGYWLDQMLSTKVLFTLGGFALGMVAGLVHLLRITKTSRGDALEKGDRTNGQP